MKLRLNGEVNKSYRPKGVSLDAINEIIEWCISHHISIRPRYGWWLNIKRKSDCGKKLRKAVVSGLIIKMPCEVCGSLKSVAHHDNYNNPLSVRWLCRGHHRDYHRSIINKRNREYQKAFNTTNYQYNPSSLRLLPAKITI